MLEEDNDGYSTQLHLLMDNTTNITCCDAVTIADIPTEEETRSIVERVIWSLIIIIILMASLIGNLLVIVSVRLHHGLREENANIFVVNLSVADMTSAGVVMVSSLHAMASDKWYFGEIVCGIVGGVNYTCIVVSMLTLCFISLDRYMAVVHALHYHVRVTRNRVYMMVGFAWVQGLCFGLVPILARWIKYDYWEVICAIVWRMDRNYLLAFVLVGFNICFAIPSVVLVVSYCKVMKIASAQNKIQSRAVKIRAIAPLQVQVATTHNPVAATNHPKEGTTSLKRKYAANVQSLGSHQPEDKPHELASYSKDYSSTTNGSTQVTVTTLTSCDDLPGMVTLPSCDNLPGMVTLPSCDDLPGMVTLPSCDNLPGMVTLPSCDDLPGMVRLPSCDNLPGMITLPSCDDLPGMVTLPSCDDLPGMGTLPSCDDLPGMVQEVNHQESSSSWSNTANSNKLQKSIKHGKKIQFITTSLPEEATKNLIGPNTNIETRTSTEMITKLSYKNIKDESSRDIDNNILLHSDCNKISNQPSSTNYNKNTARSSHSELACHQNTPENSSQVLEVSNLLTQLTQVETTENEDNKNVCKPSSISYSDMTTTNRKIDRQSHGFTNVRSGTQPPNNIISATTTTTKRNYSTSNKAVKSLLTIIIAYFICMAPFCITKLYKVVVPHETLPGYINLISSIFQYCSSAINPLIYGIFRKDFQRAFLMLLRRVLVRVKVLEKNTNDFFSATY